MNLSKRVFSSLLVVSIFLAIPVNASRWDDVKEWADEHSQEIMIGAGILVGAAAIAGTIVGGKALYDLRNQRTKYIFKTAAGATEIIRSAPAASSVSSSGHATTSVSASTASTSASVTSTSVASTRTPRMHMIDDNDIAVMASALPKTEADASFLTGLVNELNKRSQRPFDVQSAGGSLLWVARSDARWSEAGVYAANEYNEKWAKYLRHMSPKILLLVHDNPSRQYGEIEFVSDPFNAGSMEEDAMRKIKAVFSKIFSLPRIVDQLKCLPLNHPAYNQAKLGKTLQAIADSFKKQQQQS